ncbi:MAG: response regulator [Desulfatiglandaceae bacterium]
MSEKSTYEALEQKIRELERKAEKHKESPSDMTDEKRSTDQPHRVEEVLGHNKKFLHTLLDAIPIPVFYKDRTGRYLGFNKAFDLFFGQKAENIIGKSVFDIGPPELAEIYSAKDNQLFESGGIQKYESQVRNAQGILHDVVFHKAVFTDSQGNVAGIVGGIQDITERKAAEKALQDKTKELNERVKELHCLYQISNLMQKSGISLDDILQKVVDLIPATWRYSVIICARILLEDKEYSTGNFRDTKWKQVTEIMVNGESKGVLEICYLEERPYDEEGPFLTEERHLANAIAEILGRIIEQVRMREEKKLLIQLQHAQKTEAIATLAGGVAHQFNNAVMAILTTIELLEMRFPRETAGHKYFESIKRSSHRISRLTDQLLAYAQGGKYQPKDINLEDLLAGTLPILRQQIKPSIRIETAIPKTLSCIRAEYTQIQTILSAVLTNSNEAITDEGLIKITAENRYIDEEVVKQKPRLTPGPYVCLRIQDDGKGMSEEERSRILEPFFTTKFQGRGMGMAAAYGIVRNHEGWISVDSELGKGTEVRIYLPAAEAAAENGKMLQEEPAKVMKDMGTILVIEDEDMVTEVTRVMLKRLGYRVIAAKNGKSAVHMAETFDGDIDLALLDIEMPDMKGAEVYPLIMKARPKLKVIVFTGYTLEGPAQAILDAGAQDFIQKPFSFSALSKKVTHVMKGR